MWISTVICIIVGIWRPAKIRRTRAHIQMCCYTSQFVRQCAVANVLEETPLQFYFFSITETTCGSWLFLLGLDII